MKKHDLFSDKKIPAVDTLRTIDRKVEDELTKFEKIF
jgi:hypothetical protein